MFSSSEDYGTVVINSYIPSRQAVAGLNYYLFAGRHECNRLYHQSYQQGAQGTLLILTTEGEGVLRLNNRECLLSSDSLAIVPKGMPVEYFTSPSSSSWDFYWITLDGAYANNFCAYLYNNHGAIAEIPNQSLCIEQVRKLMEKDDDFHEWMVSHEICILLGIIAKDLFEQTDSKKGKHQDIAQIIHYIEQHYAEPISLDSLCQEFYISKNQLIRLFSRHTGYTPHKYLKRHRLLKACELLQMSEKSIQEVSEMTGFSTPSHFVAEFKKQHGITPHAYCNRFFPIRSN